MSVTGTGIHPSSAAAALAVKDALYARALAAFAAADEDEVDVRYGFVWPAQFDDSVAVTAVRVVPEEGALGPRRRRELLVQVDVNLVAARQLPDEQVTHARAFGLLSVLDQAVRAEPTLDGAALWCFAGEVQSDGGTLAEEDREWGRVTEVAVTFEAKVIVTS